VSLFSSTGRKIVKALYDYTGIDMGDEIPDLSFKKDDLMEVTKEYAYVSLFFLPVVVLLIVLVLATL